MPFGGDAGGTSIECSYAVFMEDRVEDGGLTEVSVDGRWCGREKRRESIWGLVSGRPLQP